MKMNLMMTFKLIYIIPLSILYFTFLTCMIMFFYCGFLAFGLIYVSVSKDSKEDLKILLTELWEVPLHETLDLYDKLTNDRTRFNKFGE